MPLTNNAVTAGRFEESIGKLWHEWLSRYFDGADHTVGSVVLDFPAAVVRIQSRPVGQPLDGVSITVTWATPASMRRWHEPVSGALQDMLAARMTFSFWLRAAGMFADGTNPQWQCQRLADRLYAVLANSAETVDLAAKGLHEMRVRPPQLVASGPGVPQGDKAMDFEMRAIVATCSVRHLVVSQT